MAGSLAIPQSKTILAILGFFEISRVFMCFHHVHRKRESRHHERLTRDGKRLATALG
jgi:hypothetical protein